VLDSLWHSLLSWYAHNRRDLPWRRTRDPYAILVSEAMLQQTGVERVIAKYHAFLDSLPTLSSLAEAATADVIRLWSGLGYNRRAVWLQRAARVAIERWGRLPPSVEDLLSLPGIGAYTARAVACFAFGAQVAICDTNVRRVLSRLLRAADTRPAAETEMLALAQSLLPPGRAYDWNQALMDLGATICTHSAPRCPLCPVRTLCKAFPMTGTAGRSPAPVVGETRPRWKEAPFAGSRRYYRGRIVEALRRLRPGEGMIISELGAQLKPGFADGDVPWLIGLLLELAADGLVQMPREGAVRLPQ